MYKKITHNIVEEHYDRPMGYWHHADENMGYGMISQFERDSIHAWAKIVWELRSLIIDITGQLGSADELETRLLLNAAEVGELLTPYYDAVTVIEFNTALARVLTDIVSLIKATTSGLDTADLQMACDASIQSFAQLLHSVNPGSWLVATIVDVFTALKDLCIVQTQARMVRDWMTGINAADSAYDLMVGGNQRGMRGFADIFSQGITNQYSAYPVTQQLPLKE